MPTISSIIIINIFEAQDYAWYLIILPGCPGEKKNILYQLPNIGTGYNKHVETTFNYE